MESNLLTKIFLPAALGIIMLGMGMTLTIADFKRIFVLPKAVLTGLTLQLLLLPITGWLIASVSGLSGELSVGLILLAICPGGATSNLITHLAKGDVALSITLTAITSCITVLSIPFLLNMSMRHFLGAGQIIELNIPQTILQIFLITVLPVSIGMILNSKKPEFSRKFEKTIKVLSGIFLILIITGAIVRERQNIVPFFIQVGPASLALNLITMTLGYLGATLMKVTHSQRTSITIEVGIQNGTLGIAIASTILNNPAMAIPSAIYSLIMFATGGLFSIWMHRIPNQT
ncbi:sodium Bile acid symporter family protein [Leptospira weilii str. 2006001853]|uniref:Sodium Bile acid symporter family protein n=4 Tax=Leptospira weilii TaxID=28184 RepID=A0A828YX43_9LEPT|nr:bile acid:sodium symporter family protein [Leptospira weilii]EMM72389.1 sodium Bile acid symporter family protein [Leptospira weilii str. 2006001855]EMY16517.1 sodium Bile acid symporter family protein [Leptospira weilii str. Ecochallenge]EKR63102.1 sodium Bile acid symporter family protein [Leptospira weilii str. 2006001853]EMN43603.1 sodium Bile acid symporter family protein [Leptospira weilii str. LNT 1234]EMN91068.1 sodium Bile acid symporter family protein [Leptospira weilii str. UI 13